MALCPWGGTSADSVSGKNCLAPRSVPPTQCDRPILVIHYLRPLIPSTPSLMHCAFRNINTYPHVSEMPVYATRQWMDGLCLQDPWDWGLRRKSCTPPAQSKRDSRMQEVVSLRKPFILALEITCGLGHYLIDQFLGFEPILTNILAETLARP